MRPTLRRRWYKAPKTATKPIADNPTKAAVDDDEFTALKEAEHEVNCSPVSQSSTVTSVVSHHPKMF